MCPSLQVAHHRSVTFLCRDVESSASFCRDLAQGDRMRTLSCIFTWIRKFEVDFRFAKHVVGVELIDRGNKSCWSLVVSNSLQMR